ncbi:hypothetical protein IAT38_003737 [Cryptococcus sp. DSM 104549]
MPPPSVVPPLFTTHPNLIGISYRGLKIERTFFLDDRPPEIAYSLNSTITLDSEEVTDDQRESVVGFPSDWKVKRTLAVRVPPKSQRRPAGQDAGEQDEGADVEDPSTWFPGDVEATEFSKKLASRVLAVKDGVLAAIIVMRPMPLWAFAAAIREMTAAGRNAPGILALGPGYGGFVDLMTSLQSNLYMFVSTPVLTSHPLVELTPEDLANNVDWERFPRLRSVTIACRRPDTVDERPFTDLHPVVPQATQSPTGPDAFEEHFGDHPGMIIPLVYPPDLEVAHAQLRHDLNGLRRLVDALRVVLPRLRPSFMVLHDRPELLVGPGGERTRLGGQGLEAWKLWDEKFEEVVQGVWGKAPTESSIDG